MMQKTSGCFISLFVLLCLNVKLNSQQFSVDSVQFHKVGIRVSYDISRPLLPYFDSTRRGFEVSLDIEAVPDYYFTLEYGRQNVEFRNTYEYSSEGYFFRAGFDYNFLAKKIPAKQYEMIFGGFRYCYASYSHLADNILVHDNYFGPVVIGPVGSSDLNAHWLEVTAGIKGELFRNFFMGWTFRGRIMLFQEKDAAIQPYFIPGFGKGDKKSALGFNYYLSYRIPLYSRKVSNIHLKN